MSPGAQHHPPPPQDPNSPFGESAKQFARGFAKGVGEESLQLYNDTKALPARVAKAGTEVAEDLESGRELRALAPLRAATHAVRHASREDAQKIAHAVVDGAVEWYQKPAYEKGKDLGRATTSIAAEAAINVLTDGLGTLRKIEKAAEVADHFRDLEKGAEQAAHAAEHLRDVERVSEAVHHKPHLERTGRGKNHLQPEVAADGPHTTFRRNHEGDVTHYVEWKDNPRNPSGFDEVKRVDTQYATPHSHHNKATNHEITTPHAHDPSTPGGVRPVHPNERPR